MEEVRVSKENTRTQIGMENHRMATRGKDEEEETQRKMDGVRQNTSNRGLVKDTRKMDNWWNLVVGEVKPLFCGQICLNPR